MSTNIYLPYTYLIGWSFLNFWYYGVEFANSKRKIANPSNLWTIYFTSSEYVHKLKEYYGDPDIIQIRKIFKTANDARNWETKVLIRMKVVSDPKWINKTDHITIDPICVSEALKGVPKSQIHKQNIAIALTGRELSEKHCNNLSIALTGLFVGELNPFYGKNHTKETIQIIKEKRALQITTIETKEKMTQTHNKRYQDNPKLKEHLSKISLGSKNRAALKVILRSPTNEIITLEGTFQKFLEEKKISHKAIHITLETNIPITKGKNKGWIMLSKEKIH